MRSRAWLAGSGGRGSGGAGGCAAGGCAAGGCAAVAAAGGGSGGQRRVLAGNKEIELDGSSRRVPRRGRARQWPGRARQWLGHRSTVDPPAPAMPALQPTAMPALQPTARGETWCRMHTARNRVWPLRGRHGDTHFPPFPPSPPPYCMRVTTKARFVRCFATTVSGYSAVPKFSSVLYKTSGRSSRSPGR